MSRGRGLRKRARLFGRVPTRHVGLAARAWYCRRPRCGPLRLQPPVRGPFLALNPLPLSAPTRFVRLHKRVPAADDNVISKRTTSRRKDYKGKDKTPPKNPVSAFGQLYHACDSDRSRHAINTSRVPSSPSSADEVSPNLGAAARARLRRSCWQLKRTEAKWTPVFLGSGTCLPTCSHRRASRDAGVSEARVRNRRRNFTRAVEALSLRSARNLNGEPLFACSTFREDLGGNNSPQRPPRRTCGLTSGSLEEGPRQQPAWTCDPRVPGLVLARGTP